MLSMNIWLDEEEIESIQSGKIIGHTIEVECEDCSSTTEIELLIQER